MATLTRWDRMLVRLGSRGLREAVAAPAGTLVDEDDALYRRLTGRDVDDLPAWQHDRMLAVALHLDRTNMLAKRILWLITDFVVAEGAGFHAWNDQVTAWLRRHWDDEDNNWDERSRRLLRNLLRDGEILFPAGVNPANGFVRWGSIPARQIKEVVPHPDNWERTEQVVLYPRRPGEPDRVLEVIRRPLGGDRLMGQALYARINDDGLRGISELYASADFLDALDQLVFSDVERQQLLKAFIWDVTVDTTDKDELKRMAADPMFQPPRPGSVRVHTPNITWQAVAPDMRAHESVASLRFLRNFIAGGHGIPEHWLGEGGDVNRAVGAVMDQPSIKTFTRLQRVWKSIMTQALRFVIDQAVIHGSLPPLVERQTQDGRGTGEFIDPRDAFAVVVPDMDTTDQAQLAQAFNQMMMALVTVEGRYISQETASQVAAMFLQQFGIEVDPQQEAERIRQQREEEARRPVVPPDRQQEFERALGTGASPEEVAV